MPIYQELRVTTKLRAPKPTFLPCRTPDIRLLDTCPRTELSGLFRTRLLARAFAQSCVNTRIQLPLLKSLIRHRESTSSQTPKERYPAAQSAEQCPASPRFVPASTIWMAPTRCGTSLHGDRPVSRTTANNHDAVDGLQPCRPRRLFRKSRCSARKASARQ
jgi:hypothetical protein